LKQTVQVKESETFLALDLGLCQSIVNDVNCFLSTSIDGLREVEIKVGNLQYVMDLLADKVEEGKKDLLEIFERFQESKLELQTLDHKLGSSKVRIDGLVHHIQFLTYANGMTTIPLPIENPPTTPIGDPQLVLVTNCPIYGSFMHPRLLLLHHVVALTTCFACLYIWRIKPMFLLVPLMGSLWI
jgi:hypothetical protein